LGFASTTVAGSTSREWCASASLHDLTGIRILHTTWDNFAGTPTNFIADLRSRGAIVDLLDYQTNPYPLLDASYDILFLQALGRVPAGQDLQGLLAWLRSGGKSILFEGVTFWVIGTANVVADSIGAGWHCRSLSAESGTMTDFATHPITTNVHAVQSIVDGYAQFTLVQSPSGVLFRRPQGEIVGAFASLENTRMVFLGLSMLWNDRLGLADNRLLANQAVDWLAELAATVAVQPVTWSSIKALYRP
jgi:hypothetical protein